MVAALVGVVLERIIRSVGEDQPASRLAIQRVDERRQSGLGIRDPGFGIQCPGFGIRDSGFRIRDPSFGIRDAGFGIRGGTPDFEVA